MNNNNVVKDLLYKSMIVCLDDILVFSPNLVSHQHHVCTVLQQLWANNLHAKLKKCVVEVLEVPFLGYIVSKESLLMDPGKGSAVVD